eukprot:COSAG02_NODE_2865_length_7868_cov_42.736002_7_plen_77_part_00
MDGGARGEGEEDELDGDDELELDEPELPAPEPGGGAGPGVVVAPVISAELGSGELLAASTIHTVCCNAAAQQKQQT